MTFDPEKVKRLEPILRCGRHGEEAGMREHPKGNYVSDAGFNKLLALYRELEGRFEQLREDAN